MYRALTAGFAAFSLLISCGFAPLHHGSPARNLAGDDLAPFLRGLSNSRIFADYPELREAPYYRLELSVDAGMRQVAGLESVRYTNGGRAPLGRLDFVLLPNIVSGSMRIEEALLDGVRVPLHLSTDGMVLRLHFARPLPPAGSVLISLRYTLTVPDSTAVGFGGLETHGGILSLAYAYPMIPASGRWNYGKPPSYGDLTANPVSFYSVEISYPRGLTLAAPGIVLRRRVRGEKETDLIALGPARDFYLQLGRGLTIVRKNGDGIELRAAVPASETQSAETALETAAHALRLYERLFGPYPYRSLTFVSDRFGALGLEFPGIIVLTSRLYGDLSGRIDNVPARYVQEATVAHEVAHQWFYALVGNDQLAEPWIDESFAQYATLRYYRERYGEEGARGFERSFRTRSELPIGGPVSSYTPKQYGPVIYARGPLFVQALSRKMGAEHFDEFLKRVNEEYRWKVVTGSDIRRSAEEICGCSLGELWREWVEPRPAPSPQPAGEPHPVAGLPAPAGR